MPYNVLFAAIKSTIHLTQTSFLLSTTLTSFLLNTYILMFQHHRCESSLKLFVLILHVLISVPNAFCSWLIFKYPELFKFAQSFHAMLTSQPFLLFCASIGSFNLKF